MGASEGTADAAWDCILLITFFLEAPLQMRQADEDYTEIKHSSCACHQIILYVLETHHTLSDAASEHHVHLSSLFS